MAQEAEALMASKKFEHRYLGHKTKARACRRMSRNYKRYPSWDTSNREKWLSIAHDLKCNWQKPVLKKLSKEQRQRITGPIKFK